MLRLIWLIAWFDSNLFLLHLIISFRHFSISLSVESLWVGFSSCINYSRQILIFNLLKMDGVFTNGDKFCRVEENLFIGSYASVILLQEGNQNRSSGNPNCSDACSVMCPQFSDAKEDVPADVQLSNSAVLTVDSRRLPRELADLFFAYKFIHIDDSQQFDVIRYFDESCEFVDQHRKQGRSVLVHWWVFVAEFFVGGYCDCSIDWSIWSIDWLFDWLPG